MKVSNEDLVRVLGAEIPTTLDPELASSSFEEHFKCIICHNVVMQPRECTQCDKWFCSDCVSLLKSRSCPACKEPMEMKAPHRGMMEVLNRTRFRCPRTHCRATYYYSELVDHHLSHFVTVEAFKSLLDAHASELDNCHKTEKRLKAHISLLTVEKENNIRHEDTRRLEEKCNLLEKRLQTEKRCADYELRKLTEKVSALELQNLIDSIDGGQPSH